MIYAYFVAKQERSSRLLKRSVSGRNCITQMVHEDQWNGVGLIRRADNQLHDTVIFFEKTPLLALLNVCRQLYHELVPLWYRHIRIMTDHIGLSEVTQWFEQLSPRQKQYLSRIDVGVGMVTGNDLGGYFSSMSIHAWIRAEEGMWSPNIEVNLVLYNDIDNRIWINGYQLAKRCRACGMSWEKVDRCLNEIDEVCALRDRKHQTAM